MAKSAPKKFCEFQTNYDLVQKKYHCLIGDWQCSQPLCSYDSKNSFPKKGCGIAKCEGELVKAMLGDTNATPPEAANNFNIVIDVPGFHLNYNPLKRNIPPGSSSLLFRGGVIKGNPKEILKRLTSAL